MHLSVEYMIYIRIAHEFKSPSLNFLTNFFGAQRVYLVFLQRNLIAFLCFCKHVVTYALLPQTLQYAMVVVRNNQIPSIFELSSLQRLAGVNFHPYDFEILITESLRANALIFIDLEVFCCTCCQESLFAVVQLLPGLHAMHLERSVLECLLLDTFNLFLVELVPMDRSSFLFLLILQQ